MEQSPFSEANRLSASQDISLILWNPKVLYRINNSPLHVPILRQNNPVHVLPQKKTSLNFTLVLFSHLHLGLQSGLSPSGVPTKTLHAPIRATCPAHLILIDLIIKIIFSEEYKSQGPLSHTPTNVFDKSHNEILKFY
jgi:hypothetical protein